MRELPFSHKWEKTYTSLFDPNSKITFPQLVAEMLIWCLSKWAEPYKSIKKGPGWSTSISKQVRNINQQSYIICNHFPNPADDPLVEIAFKNFFRKHRPNSIGQARKTDKSVTKVEKDTIKAIKHEYETLKAERDRIQIAAEKQKPIEEKPIEQIKFRINNSKNRMRALDG